MTILSGSTNWKPDTAGAEKANTARKEQDRFRIANDPVHQMYRRGGNGRAWKQLSALMRRLNPICQRVVKNPFTGALEQCHEPSTLTHHLLSPRRRPDLFLNPKNLVTLCDGCHPTSDDTPDWKEWDEEKQQGDYVKTVLPRYNF